MNIILIGFMGSGKSTVGKALRDLLGFSLVEMDEIVCQKTSSKTMTDLFAKGGEKLLRKTEALVAKDYVDQKRLIISTGGGVVLNPAILDNFKIVGGKVFFLNAPFELIAKRLEKDKTRPLFTNLLNAKAIYKDRLPLYHHYADEIVNITTQSPEELALIIKEGYFHGL